MHLAGGLRDRRAPGSVCVVVQASVGERPHDAPRGVVVGGQIGAALRLDGAAEQAVVAVPVVPVAAGDVAHGLQPAVGVVRVAHGAAVVVAHRGDAAVAVALDVEQRPAVVRDRRQAAAVVVEDEFAGGRPDQSDHVARAGRVGLLERAHRCAVLQHRDADAVDVGEVERRRRVARRRRARRPRRSGPCERVPRPRLVDVRRGVAVDEQFLGERQPPARAEVGVGGDARVVRAGEDHRALRARHDVAAEEGQVARRGVDEADPQAVERRLRVGEPDLAR